MFFISLKPGTSSSIGSPSEFHTRTKATLRAGRILVEAIYAVAATRGSFPTRRFRAVQRSDRIRRRFLFNSPNGVSSCTECRELKRCLIHFSESELPPATPPKLLSASLVRAFLRVQPSRRMYLCARRKNRWPLKEAILCRQQQWPCWRRLRISIRERVGQFW